MTAGLRPGATVRVDGERLVLARTGRTVTLSGHPALPLVWQDLTAHLDTPTDTLPRAVATLRRRLVEEGMVVERPADGPQAAVAALADGQGWRDPQQLSWRPRGRADLVAAAVAALQGWLGTEPVGDPDVGVDDDSGRLLTIDLDDVPGVVVLAHPDGFAVVDAATAPALATALHPAGPSSPGDPRTAGAPSTAPSVTLAAAVAVYRLAGALARGDADARTWHLVTADTALVRPLVPLHPQIGTADGVPAVPRSTAGDARTGDVRGADRDALCGMVIEALRADADEEVGWWDEPHPHDLPQLPVALLSSQVRSGLRVTAVGSGAAHDEAWAATALAVAATAVRSATGSGLPFAGIGPLDALADLLRRCAPGVPGEGWVRREAASAALDLLVPDAPRDLRMCDLGWATAARLTVGAPGAGRVTVSSLGAGPDAAAAQAVHAAVARLELIGSGHAGAGRYRFGRLTRDAPTLVAAFLAAHDAPVAAAEPAGAACDVVAALDGDDGPARAGAWRHVVRLVERTWDVAVDTLTLGPAWDAAGVVAGVVRHAAQPMGASS